MTIRIGTRVYAGYGRYILKAFLPSGVGFWIAGFGKVRSERPDTLLNWVAWPPRIKRHGRCTELRVWRLWFALFV